MGWGSVQDLWLSSQDSWGASDVADIVRGLHIEIELGL